VSDRKTMPEMPQQESADIVLQWLMAIRLVESEADFRAALENVAEDPEEPRVRDMVIATAAILMSLGGLRWPIVMRVMSHLRKLPDEDLKEGAVAIVNGDHLFLPDPDDRIRVLDLATLREVTVEHPPAFVSTIYSLTALWEHLLKTLTR